MRFRCVHLSASSPPAWMATSPDLTARSTGSLRIKTTATVRSTPSWIPSSWDGRHTTSASRSTNTRIRGYRTTSGHAVVMERRTCHLLVGRYRAATEGIETAGRKDDLAGRGKRIGRRSDHARSARRTHCVHSPPRARRRCAALPSRPSKNKVSACHIRII